MVDEQPLDMEEDKDGGSLPKNESALAQPTFHDKLKEALTDKNSIQKFTGGIQPRDPAEDAKEQFIELKRHSTMKKSRKDITDFTLLVNDTEIKGGGIDYLKQVHSARANNAVKNPYRKNSSNSQQSAGQASSESQSNSNNNSSQKLRLGGGRLKGSGASLSNVLPKTIGPIKLTL